MPFVILTDSSANLGRGIVQLLNLRVLPLTMTVNGVETVCYDADSPVDAEAFFERLRTEPETEVRTSMINEETFRRAFEPLLREGNDVLYVGMSSGISGTYGAAAAAAEALQKEYPARRICTIDTFAASLGEGLLVCDAARLRDEGKSIDETVESLLSERACVRQYFLVDDLMHLKRGGRLTGGAALLGTLMQIKPILMGDPEGRIVLHRKAHGRQKALRMLAALYGAQADKEKKQTVGIAHGGCEADALALSAVLREQYGVEDFLIVCYEPGTGAHVGPGTVALFFRGIAEPQPQEGLLGAVQEKLAAEAEAVRNAVRKRVAKA